MTTKYVTISKAASLIGEKVFILKSWENEFSEFLTIERDSNNSRLVSAENIEMFRKIKSFKDNHLDTMTIKQLLKKQTAMHHVESQSIEDNDELKNSLNRISDFIESAEVKELLNINDRLSKLEATIIEAVQKKIVDTAKLQTEVARIEFSDVQEMITSLSITSKEERELYKEAIHQEREIILKKTDEREERFLAFLKQYQDRQVRNKQEQKSGIAMLKQLIGFAK
ncbi:hypothetical protein CHH83_08565 [Bacillus sp. 7586-K]|nr:hypothetical protein CHH83_08565 [Bacillus sp. 7586-K]